MEKSYEDTLHDLYTNKKLNEDGLNDYIYILLGKISILKINIMDLENKLQDIKKGGR